MSEKIESLISDYVSVGENEKLAKALELFDENTREILVFDEKDVFLGYLTKRFLARQSRLYLDSKVSTFIKKVPTIKKNLAINEIAKLLIKLKIRSIPVEENGEIIGVIRDIDLIRSELERYKGKKVKELMTPNTITSNLETTAAQLLSICRNNNISRCPVVNEKNELIGIVSPHDLKPILLSDLPGQTFGDRSETQIDPYSTQIINLMSTDVVTCKQDDTVELAIEKLLDSDHKALVVVDDSNHVVGILTTHDLLETVSVPPKQEGYFINVMGEIDEEDLKQLFDLSSEFIKKYSAIIGNTGHFYIHIKSIPKKKFRGYILYHIRLRITTNKGKTYVSRSEGYGLFGAFAVALDRIERDIISEREKERDAKMKQTSTRYLLEELEEIE